jgi:cytochrome bd-type quinol oxidase subunit 2
MVTHMRLRLPVLPMPGRADEPAAGDHAAGEQAAGDLTAGEQGTEEWQAAPPGRPPGASWLARAARGEVRVQLRVPDRTFAAITVAPALLAIAWLVPGTGMLLAGRLMAVPMVIIFVPLAVALCYFTVERLPVSWPRSDEPEPGAGLDEAGPRRRGRPAVPALAVLALVVIAAGFGVWQAVLRSEQVFVTSEPGVYLQYGYWIAEHATARIPVSAAAFGGAPGLDFATPGFSVTGSSITPTLLPGLPLVLAGGTWLGGLGGALLMPAVLGGCAVLAFGGLVGRLCGPWWAVAGELVLAVGLPEVYTARSPFSEPLVQLLLFGGLCLFIDSLVSRRRILAGLGGFALGLTVLASIASLAVLLPAFPVLAVLYVTRRPQAGPFGAGLVLGLGTGLLTGLVLARAYLATVSAQLHLIGLCAFGCCAVTALTLTLAIPAVRDRARRVLARRPRAIGFKGEESLLPSLGHVAQWLALVLPVAVLVGLAERPLLQTVRGQVDPAMIRAVAALQRYAGLPVDGTRQYYESSLHWVLWYLGAPALLLACGGAASLGRRSVELVTGGAPGRPADASVAPASVRLWGLPFVIVAWSVVTVLWDPAVVPWQPMASHRLVPAVLPGFVLLGIWMSTWLMSRASIFGASRAARGAVGACCVLALAIPPLETTLNPGLVSPGASAGSALADQLRLRGVGATATYGGSLDAATVLCGAIGPSASVLVTDAATAATYAPVIRGLCGQPAALVVPGPTAAASAASLGQAIRAVDQAGRRPVLLGATRASVAVPGSVPQQAVALRTAGDAESLTGAPAGTWPVTYTAWLAVPPLSAA